MEKICQTEAYILATPAAEGPDFDYHLIVDSMFMFSTNDIIGAIIDVICYYYVLDISYPKVMNPLLVFIQHFIFGLPAKTIPISVINLCSKT